MRRKRMNPQRGERRRQQQETVCRTCVHRPDLTFDCGQFEQESVKVEGMFIVLSCTGHSRRQVQERPGVPESPVQGQREPSGQRELGSAR